MGRCWYGLWTMVLDCAIDVCLPASFVTHSNRFADILTRVGYVTPLSLSIVSCPLLLWSEAITMIFLYRVIQKSVYLTIPCDNDPVIGGRPSVIITLLLSDFPPLATAYLPRWVSSGTRHASVDFYWIVPRTPAGSLHHASGPKRDQPLRSRVAWRGVVSSSILILYADIASTERERKRDSQHLVPLSGLILNGSGGLLVVNLHATCPLRCVFFDLGLQPASHT